MLFLYPQVFGRRGAHQAWSEMRVLPTPELWPSPRKHAEIPSIQGSSAAFYLLRLPCALLACVYTPLRLSTVVQAPKPAPPSEKVHVDIKSHGNAMQCNAMQCNSTKRNAKQRNAKRARRKKREETRSHRLQKSLVERIVQLRIVPFHDGVVPALGKIGVHRRLDVAAQKPAEKLGPDQAEVMRHSAKKTGVLLAPPEEVGHRLANCPERQVLESGVSACRQTEREVVRHAEELSKVHAAVLALREVSADAPAVHLPQGEFDAVLIVRRDHDLRAAPRVRVLDGVVNRTRNAALLRQRSLGDHVGAAHELGVLREHRRRAPEVALVRVEHHRLLAPAVRGRLRIEAALQIQHAVVDRRLEVRLLGVDHQAHPVVLRVLRQGRKALLEPPEALRFARPKTGFKRERRCLHRPAPLCQLVQIFQGEEEVLFAVRGLGGVLGEGAEEFVVPVGELLDRQSATVARIEALEQVLKPQAALGHAFQELRVAQASELDGREAVCGRVGHFVDAVPQDSLVTLADLLTRILAK
eukprot:scaffold385_cov305-Pinguiococcus_pyrenoidosus.AAC.39